MKKVWVILLTLVSVFTLSLGVLADPSPDPGPFEKVPTPVITTTLIPK